MPNEKLGVKYHHLTIFGNQVPTSPRLYLDIVCRPSYRAPCDNSLAAYIAIKGLHYLSYLAFGEGTGSGDQFLECRDICFLQTASMVTYRFAIALNRTMCFGK